MSLNQPLEFSRIENIRDLFTLKIKTIQPHGLKPQKRNSNKPKKCHSPSIKNTWLQKRKKKLQNKLNLPNLPQKDRKSSKTPSA